MQGARRQPESTRPAATARAGRANHRRRGAVAVEFACVAPVMLAIVIGMLELSRVFSVQNTLETAAREGARFASLDRTGLLLDGQTSNQKLISDVKNFLVSSGFNKTDVTVAIVDAESPTTTFDLDDSDNDLKLFQIRIEIPYDKVSWSPMKHYTADKLTAALTFRNGRTSFSD